VRAFVGLVAGFMEVPLLPFEIFNLIGTAVWATVLSVIGYELGSDWAKVSKNFSHASDALAAVVIVVLVALIAYKAREVRKERQADAAAAALGGTSAGGEAVSAPTAAPAGKARHRAPTDRKGG
jgi:hypothetical protein